jgi:endonuclease-3
MIMNDKNVVKILGLVAKDLGIRKKDWYKDRRQKWESRRSEPFKSLIGSVLSARNRDESTAMAVEKLFSKYDTPEKLANADIQSIEQLIKRSGFYKTKARYVKQISKIIHEQYDDKVPDDMDRLLALPGVGRKIAGVVMTYTFGKGISIPVDTHVHRCANRIGLVKTKNPNQTEKELMKIVPKKYWILVNELFVSFGKKTCKPIGPKHGECPVRKYCDFYKSLKK